MSGQDQYEWNKWHNDPSNWFWGTFYFNRKDKRLLVPKKIPFMGLTINCAHPLGAVVLISIFLMIALLGMFT